MAKKEYANIIYEKKERVATITLNRPQVLNALNVASWAELDDALGGAEDDVNIGAIVITGAGDRAFCAGADIPEIQALTSIAARDFSLSLHEYTRHMERIKKPIIAKINGFCLGGGQEVACLGQGKVWTA
jgi:enoyl-CoA hydratase